MPEMVKTYTADSGALAPDGPRLSRPGPVGQLAADVMNRRWAMSPETLQSLLTAMRGDTLQSRPAGMVLDEIADNMEKSYKVIDGVAIIPIQGIMFRCVPWIYDWLGIECADTSRITEWVEEAAADPAIKSILIAINSPGGEVAGTHALAATVYKARMSKTVNAYIQDLGASAAYWVASQADHIDRFGGIAH